MRVIDIDPVLLQKNAAAALHAAEQAAIHMDGEIACREVSGVPKLLETLTPTGPWAWAIKPEIRDDGGVKVPIATTLEDIAAWYRVVRGQSNVLGFEPLVEIRGTWYDFQEGMSLAYVPSLDVYGETETIGLFPVTTSKGITGELAWWRMQRSDLGPNRDWAEPVSDMQARRDTLVQHDRFLAALRRSDVDGLLGTMSEGVQSAVRDYVEDTGTLVSLDDKEGHRRYYERVFDLYSVERVDLLHRIVQPWYMFAELRYTVVPKRGSDAGRTVAFHTAEFLIPAADGRFIGRIGHGTDLAVVDADSGEGGGR